MTVGRNHIIGLRYIMRNEAGDVLEDRMNAAPVAYLQGGNIIMRELQNALDGLGIGEKKHLQITIPHRNETLRFDVVIDIVREATREELILGYPVNTEVQPCLADCDCYRE